MKIGNSLDRIRIAAPCPFSWERMTGDDRVRFCDECNLHVYNIGEMTRSEAETLIANTEGRLCARLYRRDDGTVITRDCPAGLRAIRRRVARSATAAFVAVMALATSAFGQKTGSKDKNSCREQVVMTRDLTQIQNSLNTVAGKILDLSGAVVPNADITITAETRAKPLTTSSDSEGKFLVAGLETGTYEITIKALGFMTHRIVDVKLKGNEILNLEVTMEVGKASIGIVGIIGADPLIDSPPGTLIINQKMIQRLPIH